MQLSLIIISYWLATFFFLLCLVFSGILFSSCANSDCNYSYSLLWYIEERIGDGFDPFKFLEVYICANGQTHWNLYFDWKAFSPNFISYSAIKHLLQSLEDIIPSSQQLEDGDQFLMLGYSIQIAKMGDPWPNARLSAASLSESPL